MFASIHPEIHYFCYFLVLGTAKAVMLKCLDLFILSNLLFYYFAYSQAAMFLTFDIDVFLHIYIWDSFAESCEFYRFLPIRCLRCRNVTKWHSLKVKTSRA